MADLFESVVLFFISEECYDKFFVEFDFLDVPCLKAALSKALGLAIIAGSVMVKVPQITKILNSRSAEGISILSVLLDLFAITSNVAYSYVKGFPFSAWGEGLFLALQTAVIAALVFFFLGSVARSVAFVASYVSLLVVLLGGLTPVDVLWSMQALNMPIIVVGKSRVRRHGGASRPGPDAHLSPAEPSRDAALPVTLKPPPPEHSSPLFSAPPPPLHRRLCHCYHRQHNCQCSHCYLHMLPA